MNEQSEKAEHYFAANPKSKVRYGLIRTCLRGKLFEFLTASGVFSKSRIDLGTRLLAESMRLPSTGCVLDLGCGYGVIGIVAASLNPELQVIMVDVNSRAIRLARRNVERNLVCNAEVRKGDLYAPVKGLVFDCILSNPPVSAGLETLTAIVHDAPKHIGKGGFFQMVVKSKVAGKRLCMILEEAFGNVEISARESGYRVLTSQKQ